MRVAGIGFRSAATMDSLREALKRAIGDGPSLQAIATETDKAATPVFRDLAADLSVPVLAINSAALAGIFTPTQSQRVQERYATGSLAEASALAAAGPGAWLVTTRVVSHDGMATAAIAENEGTDT
ncbi:cobalamin biosynthesis protein [Roseovarius aestuarii]|nr:cobalamin biosynthesis protein [Roseovarius aestuarii]